MKLPIGRIDAGGGGAAKNRKKSRVRRRNVFHPRKCLRRITLIWGEKIREDRRERVWVQGGVTIGYQTRREAKAIARGE